MSDCIECGAKVRNSEVVCEDCLAVAAAWIKQLEKKRDLKDNLEGGNAPSK